MSDMTELRQGFVLLQNTLNAAIQLARAVRTYDVTYQKCLANDKAVELAADHLTQLQRDRLVDMGTFVAQHRAAIEAILADLPKTD